MSQNIWEQKTGLHRQKRRAQLVQSYLKKYSGKKVLDIGCAEGYTTSFISMCASSVVAVEINIEYLKVAIRKVKNVEFINASIVNLPFRPEAFDGVCILEVIEHLDLKTQKKGLEEVDCVLKSRGRLVISIPYKENIVQSNCIHCGRLTPLYGHLRSMDESDITGILPDNRYELFTKYQLPNIPTISCKSAFEVLPLRVWILMNNVFGILGRGYWIVLQYVKRG